MQTTPKTLLTTAMLLAAPALILAPSTADAFEVKRTDTGAEIHWTTSQITYRLNEAGSQDMSFEEARGTVQRSFGAWSQVSGSGLELVYGGETQDATLGYQRGAQNINLVVWEEEAWAFDASVLAVTLTTFAVNTGQLLDADIVINGVNYDWDTQGARDKHDLANSLTHEVGHFVGLDHSEEEDATMFPTAPVGELQKRDLTTDDLGGLFYLYGNGESPVVDGGADPFNTPNGEDGEFADFDDTELDAGVRLNDAQIHLNCSTTSPVGRGTGSGGALASMLGLLLGAAMIRRRRDLTRAATVCIAAGAAVMALAAPADATTVKELTLDEMAARADRVVLAQVIERTAAFEDGVIYTTSVLRVEDCADVACVEGEELVLRTVGGRVGDIAQSFSGMVEMAVGERAVVFVSMIGGIDLTYRPLGLSQGVLKIDTVGVRAMATRDLAGLDLLRADSTHIEGDALSFAMPIDELFAAVRQVRKEM